MKTTCNLLCKLIVAVSIILFAGCKKSPVTPSLPNPPAITITSALLIGKSDIIVYPITAISNGVKLDPSTIKWSSANTGIATVDINGYVTAISIGETVITATLINGQGSAQCKVTVYDHDAYKLRLVLKDKGTSSFSISNPADFLSAKAIARRKKENISVDATDLPISPDYLKKIRSLGGIIVAQSKWLNTVCVYFTDGSLINAYKNLPFVQDVVVVWQESAAPSVSSADYPGAPSQIVTPPVVPNRDSAYYGAAWNNIKLDKGQALHVNGFAGAGVDIAVIDGGFNNLRANPAFSNTNIKGAKSFLYEDANPYVKDSHGVQTSSLMAVNKPGYFVGTAPEANYWFFRTEDSSSEFLIEEDYYVAALEYADSAGVAIVSTSLGYTYHDGGASYTYKDMNGTTATASRGANMAFAKGIFIAVGAGNNGSWVGAPADASGVLTTGSVNISGVISDFSSYGFTVDGRIKPDVVALGNGACTIDIGGARTYSSGTSFTNPIICGLVACLWEAYPKLDNKDLLSIIKQSADRFNSPLLPYGYGIPDMQKAMLLAKTVSDAK
jgi:hypothetical protein